MKTILLLTDFSKKAEHAAELALEIAERVEAKILLYNAFLVPEFAPMASAVVWQDNALPIIEEDSSARLKKLALRLKEKAEQSTKFNVPITCLNEPGTIADSIATVVKTREIWMVVMGTKGDNGISNFLFGSNAFAAIDRANCPVLLIPEKAKIKDVRKIALATDLQYSNSKGVEFLAELAEAFKSEVLIAHVCSEGNIQDGNHQDSRQFLKQLMSRFQGVTSTYRDIEGDEVESRLEEFSMNEQIDILTVIHRRYNLIERIFHSSTTKVLIRHSNVPLLVLSA